MVPTLRKDFLLYLYSLPQTVFSLKELALLFPDTSYSNLKRRVHYSVEARKLLAIRPGIYAKEGYSTFELANKIYAPSYISFETVLQQQGLIFQPYESLFLAANISRQITVGGQRIRYRKLKPEILTNHEGVVFENNYHIASKERAFLDTVFLDKDRFFDHLDSLDWERVGQLVKMYGSRALAERVKSYAESSAA